MPKALKPKVAITDTRLKSLKPTGQRYEIRDSQAPGLCVRVSEKGARTFVLKTRYPGSTNPTRRALGEYPAMTLSEAREKAGEWRKLIKRGVDPSLVEAQARQAAVRKLENTFEAVAEDFIAQKLPGERRGKEVERDIRRVFIPKWRHRPITEITDLDIHGVIKEKRKSAPVQARNLLALAKRFFAWVVDERVYGLTSSPAEGLKPNKIIGPKVSATRILTDDELFALWRAANRMPYPYGPAYRLLILTALRLNEAVDADRGELHPAVARALRNRKEKEAIDWSGLAPDDRVWTIAAERMKGRNGTARAHEVPLTDDMLALLEKLPTFKNGRYLFSTTAGEKPVWIGDKVKKQIDARMLRTLKALSRVRGEDPSAVTLEPWTNHDIRRTVRSHLSRLKISEEAREAVLAHVRPGIKRVYDQHDYFEEKREALELWGERLRGIVGLTA